MSGQPTAKTARLGRLIASYAPLPRSRTRELLRLALLAAVAAAAGGWAAHRQQRWEWLLLSVLGALICWFVLLRKQRASRRIELYQRGLVWIAGRRQRILSWNQIGEVYSTEPPSGGRLRYRTRNNSSSGWRLVAQDGRQWWLKNFEGLGSLGSRIQTELIRLRLPSVVDAFNAGYPVRFGPQLSLSREGVQIGLKCLPWHEVNEIALDSTHGVRITCAAQREPRIRLAAARVPNLGLLAALLDAIHSGQNRQAPLEYLTQDDLNRPTLVGGPDGLSCDPNDLLAAGYDWDDIHSIQLGETTLDELHARGPRHRPRRPR